MLPEIVRAAAEPMANIKDLTVLSTDGASELVKNGTRTVAEASAVVKGVTGIDIPSLIGTAMGGRGTGEGSGGTGGQEGPDGGGGGGRSRAPRPSTGGPAASGAGPASAGATPAAPSEAAWFTPAARPPAPSGPPSAASAPEPAQGPTAPTVSASPAAPAAPTIDEAQAAMARADDAMRMAREATSGALASRPVVESAATSRETTINVAAQRLARDLQAIPGIERFGALRLGELDRAGPRPLRTMWRIARDQLGERYGEMTIGEVLARYGRGGGSAGTSA